MKLRHLRYFVAVAAAISGGLERFFQGGLGKSSQQDGAFHGFARVVMMLARPGQQSFHPS